MKNQESLTQTPSQALLRGVKAALARPTLLDPRAVNSVRAATVFAIGSGDPSSETEDQFYLDDDVAIVTIQGPLAQRAWSCFGGMFGGDGYDAIEQRILSAISDSRVSAVLMRIDSPGGEVAGCFEAVRAIRLAATAAGKPLVAYVDEQATSAAYALATVANVIVLPDTGMVGSVGVIVTVVDYSAMNEVEGVKYHVITSGPRKSDGHPDVPLSEDARAEIQSSIDYLAQIFSREVSSARSGLTPDGVLALDAGIFFGAAAVDAGLADQVGNSQTAMSLAREMGSTMKQTRRVVSAQIQREKTMANITDALGLPQDATEADQLAAIHNLKDFRSKAHAIAGENSDGDALGSISAFKAAFELVPSLKDQVKILQDQADHEVRAGLIKLGADKTEHGKGNLTPAMVEKLVPDWSTETLRKFVNTAPKIMSSEKLQEPASGSGPGSGKTFEQLSDQEKHELYRSDIGAYRALKSESEKRLGRA